MKIAVGINQRFECFSKRKFDMARRQHIVSDTRSTVMSIYFSRGSSRGKSPTAGSLASGSCLAKLEKSSPRLMSLAFY